MDLWAAGIARSLLPGIFTTGKTNLRGTFLDSDSCGGAENVLPWQKDKCPQRAD